MSKTHILEELRPGSPPRIGPLHGTLYSSERSYSYINRRE